MSQLLFVFLTATSRVKKVDIISGREGGREREEGGRGVRFIVAYLRQVEKKYIESNTIKLGRKERSRFKRTKTPSL